MYHLDGSDYLKEKYYRKTFSICPECMERIPAIVKEDDDEKIYMYKTCPEHGDFKDLISSSAKYYKWTHYAVKDEEGKVVWQFEKNGEANPP
ncbi:MAG: hypothetical protein ACFFA6_14460, partial [Promethearchaeota archaeon]